ncbi:Cuticle protein 10.9, partial [Stegodyphus mimosarum]
MIFVVVFAAALALVNGQAAVPVRDYRINPYYYDESPKPYSFSYSAPLDDGVGQSSRSETADGTGRVEGSYSLNNDEGHFRVVDYVADRDGFRASIRTNEPGTDNKNPADVIIESSAVPYSGPYYPRGVRRPVLNAPVEPVAPVVPAPEAPVVPPAVRRPPVYRRPVPYRRPY